MKELYSENSSKTLGVLQELKQQSDSFKNSMVNLWERCVNFSNGNQLNDYFNGGLTTNQNGQPYRKNRRQNIYVSNEIEPIIRTLASFLTRSKPSVNAFTASDHIRDKNRAQLAERLLVAKYELDREQNNSREIAHWSMVLGTCFRKDYWDITAGANYEVPEYDELGEKEYSSNGEVQTRYQKTGSNAVAILTPYSMDFDYSCTNFEEMPYIQENYLKDIDWVKQSFDRNLKGFNRSALTTIQPGDYNSGPLINLEQLKFANHLNYRGYTPKTSMENKVLVSEVYIRPSDEWPKGRMLVIVNGQILYDSPKSDGSPYYLGYEDLMWHPYTMFTYEPWIGRFLGKGIVEQLLPLQMRLNEINGAILENANTLAKVDVLSPKGSLRRGVLNGAGGNNYEYNYIPGQPAPIKWPGVPLPQQFFQERQNIIDQMVRIAGTNFVMQGQPPTGITAASAIQQLLENASSQQSDLVNAWEKFHEEGFTKKLRLIRNYNNVPDKEVIDYMRMTARDATDRQIKDFIGEDIGDGLTVTIEKGSMIPKSESIQRENLLKFAEYGVLGNLAEPGPQGDKLRMELLSKFGEKPLETTSNVELEKAQWENERVVMGDPIQVSEFDVDAIHLSEHVQLFQSPNFIERNTDEVKQALYQHIQVHKQKQAQEQQEAQMQQEAQITKMAQLQNKMKLNEIELGEKLEAQGESQVEMIKGKNKLAETDLKSQTEIEKQLIESKTDLEKQRIEAIKELEKQAVETNRLAMEQSFYG